MDPADDIEGALDALDHVLSDESRQAIREIADEDDFAAGAHFGLGTWVRNNHGLWGASRLKKVFLDSGIWHPDTMSGIILRAYYRRLHGRPLEIADLVAQAKKAEEDFDWL